MNFLDIVNALKELGVDLDELLQFAKNSEPVPFAFGRFSFSYFCTSVSAPISVR